MKKNIIFSRLLAFAIAVVMLSSTVSMVSVTSGDIVTSGAPLPDPVVDGVITAGEYDGGMHIVLEGPWDSPTSPYDGPLDGYLYWDTQYLWIAVNEPVPEWIGGGSFIEFMWDAGIHGTMPYYHAWVLFSDGNWQYVRCGKPSGSWGWAADPFPGHSWWATNTATEFKFDYTDYGTQYGDTIKLIVDSADRSASSLTFGNCQIWPYVSPSNPDYYPSETPASVATWGDVTLGGAGPPIADAGGPYGGLVGASIPLDGTGSFDIGGTIVSYEWDLDYDGLYDDATGSTTTNSWFSEGSYTISLKVTDNDGFSDTDDATVNIGGHAVDGVISSGEYDGGMNVQLVGRPPESSWTVDAYIDWDSQYLYVAIDEPTPPPPYIEFAFDAGPHRSVYDVFTLFSGGGTNHQTAPKPSGSGGWSSAPYVFEAFSGTATEFKVDYTDFGIALGDTIQMCIERGPASPNAYWPAGGLLWDGPGRTPDASTWGDVMLSGGPPPNIPPVADANGPYRDTNCDDDYSITFDGTGSSDPDGTIVSYDWDFGDGTGYHNDIGATPSYTYPIFGEYTVTLRVTDNGGLIDTDTSTAKVYGVIADANGPYEDTDWDYSIDFDGSGSTGYETPLTYDWDFGDGTGWHNDIGATPSYTYSDIGEYTVTLRVTESGNGCSGCSDTDTATVKIIAILILIDIKPGSYPNSINPESKGKLPVAILTTEDFDASTVDPTTIDFLGASPLRWALEDVDDDGDFDMILHFKTRDCDFSLLVDEGDKYPYGYLTGETIDGTQIEGKDTVRLIGQLFEIFEQLSNRFPILRQLSRVIKFYNPHSLFFLLLYIFNHNGIP